MSEPLEYYGVTAACQIIGTHNSGVQKKLGEPDAIMRRGCLDNGLWLCSRVLEYAISRTLRPGPVNPPTYYTVLEGSRLVGVTQMSLRTILKNQGLFAPALL